MIGGGRGGGVNRKEGKVSILFLRSFGTELVQTGMEGGRGDSYPVSCVVARSQIDKRRRRGGGVVGRSTCKCESKGNMFSVKV